MSAESESRSVPLDAPQFAALDAIGWLLRQVQENPDFHWLLFCTETLALQTKAYAALTGKPLEEVRKSANARHFQERGLRARAVVLEEQLEEARRRIEELERQLKEAKLHAA